jgi:hypothetical protein
MKRDLFVLVPGKNEEFALRGALARPKALGVRPIDFEFRPHPGRDGGIRTSGASLLTTQRHRFNHGLLLLDIEGSGAGPDIDALELESRLDRELAVGWGDNAKAVVVSPEVDIWLWGAENALKHALDWNEAGGVRDWLEAKGFVFSDRGKPVRPKEAIQAVTRHLRIPRSSALYESITGRISLSRCRDPAFARLQATLQRWFAAK